MFLKFPHFNKCCFCMDLATGVKVFSYIFAVLEGISILYTRLGYNAYVGVLELVEFVSLIFFIIGFTKVNNKLFLQQFVYVQLVVIILSALGLIFIIGFSIFMMFSGKVVEDSLTQQEQQIDIGANGNISYHQARTLTTGAFIFFDVGAIIGFALKLYYFLASGAYATELIDEIERNENTKNLEANY